MHHLDNLISLYQKRLHLPDASFARIDNEDAMVGLVYKVMQPNGPDLILKICTRPQDYLREVYFLNYFADKIPVPRILKVVPPEAILMECLPGAPLKPSDLTDELAFEIGSLLAKIHLNRAAGYGDLTQPNDLSPDPRVYFTQKFEEGLNECINHLPQTLLEQYRRYLNAHIDLLATVDGPCMIHRDFRPANVIVHEGKVQGIIDWSSGRASFAQEDFCPMEHGEWHIHPPTKMLFLAGYESIREVPDYTDMMPLLRLHRALAVVGFTVKQKTWETSHAHVYQVERKFIENFFQKSLIKDL